MKGQVSYRATTDIEAADGKVYRTDVYLHHSILRCVNCKRDTYRLIRGEARVIGQSVSGISPPIITQEPPKVLRQYPLAMPVSHPSVPSEVSKAAVEAEKCLSIGAFNACGVTTRRAMHALCLDKGAKGRDLYEQLIHLRDRAVITPDIW